MMKLPKLLLGSAILVCANFAVAQSATSTTTTEVPSGAVAPGTATTPLNQVAPAVPGAAVDASGSAAVTATPGQPSADPYVQKREADGAAKSDYKMRKNMAKDEYKEEKAHAKSDLKAEKRQSARERRSGIDADKKTSQPNDISGN